MRDSEKGSQVASQYSNVRLVYGTLDSHDLLEEQAKKADIVLSRLLPHMYKVSGADELWLPDCANADHEGAVKAILRGLSSHSAPQPGYLVHTSGTGTLCWADLERETFGEAANKTYDDWDGVQELTSLPDKAPHRNVDKVILAEGTENADVLRTAIVCPPCIYGKGRGPGNQRSIQMPDLAKCILQGKKGFQVGSGRTLCELPLYHIHHDQAFPPLKELTFHRLLEVVESLCFECPVMAGVHLRHGFIEQVTPLVCLVWFLINFRWLISPLPYPQDVLSNGHNFVL